MDKEKEIEDEKLATLNIKGMNCASCARTIENKLDSLDGTYQVNLNLATEKASVKYDPEKLKIRDLEKAVRDVGYEIEKSLEEKDELNIEGMTCTSCAQTVEKSLKDLEGVKDATVNFASEKAFLSYDASEVDKSDFKQAVKNSGYDVGERRGADEIEDSESKLKDSERKVEKAKKKMYWTWLFVAPIIAWMIPEMTMGIKWPSPLVFYFVIILYNTTSLQ